MNNNIKSAFLSSLKFWDLFVDSNSWERITNSSSLEFETKGGILSGGIIWFYRWDVKKGLKYEPPGKKPLTSLPYAWLALCQLWKALFKCALHCKIPVQKIFWKIILIFCGDFYKTFMFELKTLRLKPGTSCPPPSVPALHILYLSSCPDLFVP